MELSLFVLSQSKKIKNIPAPVNVSTSSMIYHSVAHLSLGGGTKSPNYGPSLQLFCLFIINTSGFAERFAAPHRPSADGVLVLVPRGGSARLRRAITQALRD